MSYNNVSVYLMLLISMGLWSGFWGQAMLYRYPKHIGRRSAALIFSAVSFVLFSLFYQNLLHLWAFTYGMFLITFVLGFIFQRSLMKRATRQKVDNPERLSAKEYIEGEARIYNRTRTVTLLNVTSATITIVATVVFILRFVHPHLGLILTVIGSIVASAMSILPYYYVLSEDVVYKTPFERDLLPSEYKTFGIAFITSGIWMFLCLSIVA